MEFTVPNRYYTSRKAYVHFLCDTIARKSKIEWLRNKLGFKCMVVVEPQGRSGGLKLLLKKSDQASLIGLS